MFSKNNGSQNSDPRNGINEVEQPAQIEAHELFVVFLSDAGTHPNTMMVVSSNTNVAIGTVGPVGWLVRPVKRETTHTCEKSNNDNRTDPKTQQTAR